MIGGYRGIFDVDNLMRVHSYSPTLWPSQVGGDREELSAHFKSTWDNRTRQRTYMQILTDIGEQKMKSGR